MTYFFLEHISLVNQLLFGIYIVSLLFFIKICILLETWELLLKNQNES